MGKNLGLLQKKKQIYYVRNLKTSKKIFPHKYKCGNKTKVLLTKTVA